MRLSEGSYVRRGERAAPDAGCTSLRAAAMFTSPAPYVNTSYHVVYVVAASVSRKLVTGGKCFTAVLINVAFTWWGDKEGIFWSSSAAAPLTTGVAMLVPLNTK